MSLITRLATACAALLLVAGCAKNDVPRFDMSSGEPEQIRRYTGRPARDFIFRFDARAFDKVDEIVDSQLTPGKMDVLQRHGQPQYLRRNVAATRNEVFEEWVYDDRNTLVQFVQGELVYEGPLLDSDRVLVEHGYPSKAWVQQYETGPMRETWIYDDLVAVRERIFSFSDGELVYQANF